LFGEKVELRWRDDYFPFTEPSFELDVKYNKEWLELLGCGIVHQDVLRAGGRDPTREVGWAFGLGLERLAMVLYSIPDIRLFWSEDVRFLSQFTGLQRRPVHERRIVFEPYSKYPFCYKDVSFWLPENKESNGEVSGNSFHHNDVYEVCS